MSNAYFDIKDNCRKGLLKYLLKAISTIPAIESPMILDIVCGSGVPTLALAEYYTGSTITAVDIDTKSLNRLTENVTELNLSNRITVVNCSLFDMEFEENLFDIILAEGLLNVVGFKKGFSILIKLLKRNGYFIIHDEFQNHTEKTEFIERNNCKILDVFFLDEHIWWSDYFKCLEEEISLQRDNELLELFKPDLSEIELFKQNPSQFNSAYYVIEKY